MAPRSYYSLIFHMYLVIQKNDFMHKKRDRLNLEADVVKFLNFLDQAIRIGISNLHLSFP